MLPKLPSKPSTNLGAFQFAKMVKSAGEEAAQEALQTVVENIVANTDYDPTRAMLDGAKAAAKIGGIIGSILGGVGAARRPRAANSLVSTENPSTAAPVATDGQVALNSDPALAVKKGKSPVNIATDAPIAPVAPTSEKVDPAALGDNRKSW